MHTFDITFTGNLPHKYEVGDVVMEVVGLRLTKCVVLDRPHQQTVTLCPADHVESFDWNTRDWVPYDSRFAIHRERPEPESLAKEYVGEWARPCFQHDPIDNGTRVSECRNCRQRMEFRNWEWSLT